MKKFKIKSFCKINLSLRVSKRLCNGYHNIKSLIIYHHEINKPYPKANVIINPKKNNGYKEYDYLCATSLTYFLPNLLF